MHLDETILQSKTTMNLVEFIDELMEIVSHTMDPLVHEDTHRHITNNYARIKKLHDKAMIKRNKPYRKEG